ncbi:winged helix-turn-helix transcriptional regulator [Granulicoccus phenolivorans]|uniref:winged helix-turn-helix transcriptional regulator n=1 Tax=Granulicoccus phenolivorans TaxID=266854 RepID=UPI00040B5DC6|nr:helix-turn-helix domain-containing protein [Granulicoccus phenolivorans]
MPIKRTYASHGDACATAHAVELLGDRWSYPVLRELMLGPKRFSELAAALWGITPAVLTARLRQLEGSGLVRRVTLPAPARATAYECTPWARELQPIFQALGRWAVRSPLRADAGGGLTPDAMVQSMLTMAPARTMDPPLELELEFADARSGPAAVWYAYRLRWADRLVIERSTEPDRARAGVRGDSSAWARVLYEDAAPDAMEITGDPTEVARLIEAYAGTVGNGAADSAGPG